MKRSFAYIDNEADLSDLIKKLQKAERISLDTEADSLHHYFEKVCLIQLSIEGVHYVVDPLSEISLSKFVEALSKKPLILHGADFDLRMLKTSFGFRPKQPVFDTMLASQILGYEKFGLAALVEKMCHVKLSKSGQKSNWARRPLTEEQLKYASDDTKYLEKIADKLTQQLEKLGRLEWHKEACEKVVKATGARTPSKSEEAWRLKGAGVLDRKALAYLRELWQWRDLQARQVDRPPFMILGNQQMIALAKWLSRNQTARLSKGPKLPKNCVGSRLRALESAVQKVRNMPQSKWPEKKKGTRPDDYSQKDFVETLRKECKQVAGKLQLETSVLAPKSALKQIAFHRPKSIDRMMKVSGLMRWQAEVLLPVLEPLLAAAPKEQTPS